MYTVAMATALVACQQLQQPRAAGAGSSMLHACITQRTAASYSSLSHDGRRCVNETVQPVHVQQGQLLLCFEAISAQSLLKASKCIKLALCM